LESPVEKPFELSAVESKSVDQLPGLSSELTGPLVLPTDRPFTYKVTSVERQHLAMPIVYTTCGIISLIAAIHVAACFNPNISTKPIDELLARPVTIGFFGLSITMVTFTFATNKKMR
jgi:hypothetical protein